MNNFSVFQTKNIDELADWLDKHGAYDNSIWGEWFDKNYCSKCEPVKVEEFEGRSWCDEYAWCEVNGKCKHFQELDMIPSNKQVVKMWLESEAE